jgi:hypothetical protein
MNAALLQRAEYREYSGPAGIPDSTTRPYAFSEQVPRDKIWIILAASARDRNQTGSTALWLYAVPPNPSDAAAGNAVYSPLLHSPIFLGKIANQVNAPPLVAGVQLSRGGPGATTKEMLAAETGNSLDSVNLLDSVRPILPPRWMLTVMQDGNNGGGGNMLVTLSLMILPIAIGEDLGNKNNFVSFRTRAFAVGSGG